MKVEVRINKEDFITALEKIYNMSKEERYALGLKGKDYVHEKYNFEKYITRWQELLVEAHEK